MDIAMARGASREVLARFARQEDRGDGAERSPADLWWMTDGASEGCVGTIELEARPARMIEALPRIPERGGRVTARAILRLGEATRMWVGVACGAARRCRAKPERCFAVARGAS